ncbi:MAG: glycosyltransferase 87 family protein [Hyphomicrobiales bacterium]
MTRHALLLLLGVPAAIALASLAAAGDLGLHARTLVLVWGAAHVLYLGASWVALRGAASRRARTVALVLAVGLVPRLALLPQAPTLSEDLYRYLWDGRLVAAGVNPFPHPPDDPALARFQDGLLRKLNHADVPTIYPPAAQLLFGATARIEASPRAWKATLFVLEAILVAALAFLLARRGAAPERLLLYYWNPLVVVEGYGQGHLDVALAAFLLLALALDARGRRIGAGIAFALAVLTKYVPLLLLPALVRRRRWALLGTAAVAGALLFLPFAGAGRSLGGGLLAYARNWEWNGSLYALLRPLFHRGEPPRFLLAAALAVAALVVTRRARTLTGAALALWMAFLIASPTVFPWYLVPAVALLPLHPDPGLLVFSGLVALSYLPLPAYRATGVWTLPPWIPWVEYGGLALAWIAAAALARRRARAGPGG